MKAKSINGTNLEEIKSALGESIKDGFKPTLAIVFLSVKQNIAAISKTLDEQGISVFGATTNGEFIDEEIGKESIAILLMDMNKEYFSMHFNEFSDKNYRTISQNIARDALDKFDNPAFLIAGCHLETDAEELLGGFIDVVGKDVNLSGCMAGDDFSFTEQFVFTTNCTSNIGVVTLVLDGDRIGMEGRAICGWKAVGTEKTVTKSEGNRVFTIDHIPALDITAKFGGITDVTEENQRLVNEIGGYCALQLQRENGPPVMRPGLRINWEDHSFFCSGTVPQGSKVKFSLPPDFDAIEEVVKGCQELKEELTDIDALIYITCAGRLVTFGPVMSQEIEGIKEVWDVPMVGMFSNAELGRAKGGEVEMQNLSSVCVVLYEKESA